MHFNEYQKQASTTAVYPEISGLSYLTLGLAGEAGETANKVKKIIRNCGGVLNDEARAVIMDEISDVLWYAAMLSAEIGYDFDDVAQHNLDKLAERAKKNELKERNNTAEQVGLYIAASYAQEDLDKMQIAAFNLESNKEVVIQIYVDGHFYTQPIAWQVDLSAQEVSGHINDFWPKLKNQELVINTEELAAMAEKLNEIFPS